MTARAVRDGTDFGPVRRTLAASLTTPAAVFCSQRAGPISEQKHVEVRRSQRASSHKVQNDKIHRTTQEYGHTDGLARTAYRLQQAFQRMARLEQPQILEGHTDRVWNVAWSPKGTDTV